MKKIITLFILVVLFISFIGCSGISCSKCRKENEPEEINSKTGMFYKASNLSDTIYSIKAEYLSNDEYVMVASLQGIKAQTSSSIFIVEDYEDKLWIDNLKVKENLNVIDIVDPWDLVSLFASSIKDNKYVLYNLIGDNTTSYSDQSINYATTIAGVENYLLISKGIEEDAKNHGLTLGIDATSSLWSTEYVFDTYKDQLNNSYLIHQNPSKLQLRDYAIAGKAMCFYSDFYDGSDTIKEQICSWAKPNASIFGWTENEINFVSANSLLSKVTVAADWAANLSLYSSVSSDEVIKQINHKKTVTTAEKGKHYLSIVMSDGDNVQWMTNSFAFSKLYYGSKYRGDYKMTWTIAPSLYDVAPNILSYLYDNQSANDYFIAGPSGAGYINASEYNPASIKDYAAYTAGYMKSMDTKVVNFIDSFPDKTSYEHFAKYDEVSGGILSIGDYYIEGKGSVYWCNDKPFISVRDTLWQADGATEHNKYYGYTERVAQRINEYKTDPSSIEGYTVLICHAWSIGSMEYIARFVDALDDHVELVTTDELIDLVQKNVKHEDVEELDDIKPSDLDNRLCPISTEQYRQSDLVSLNVNQKRRFTTEDDFTTWEFGYGGLQYDFAGIRDDKVTLDGSDLEDRLEAFPNSYIYSKFLIGENDKILQLKVNSGENSNTNMRVRAIEFNSSGLTSTILTSDKMNGEVDDNGYYLLSDKSPSSFEFDLTPFIGKEIIISIEQDDNGEGSGEIININKILIANKIEEASQNTSWDISGIVDEWQGFGSIVVHNEGVCLENNGSEASISCLVDLPSSYKTLVISARKFVRVGSKQDKNAKIVIKINDEVLMPKYSDYEYITITLGDFRYFSYDISKYAGSKITIEISNIEGEHACFESIYFE